MTSDRVTYKDDHVTYKSDHVTYKGDHVTDYIRVSKSIG